MKKVLFISALLFHLYASAQINKVWDKVLGSIYTENPVLISKNPSGTVDVIASVSGTGTPLGNAQGFDVTTGFGRFDYWFCKLDKNGQKIPGSDKTYGGALEDEAISAVQTNDGGYLICGKSKSTPLPASNTSVLWVVKIDAMGTMQWQKQVDLHAAVPSGNGACDLTGHMAVCNTSSGYAVAVTAYSPGSTSNYFTFLVLFDLAGNQAIPVNVQSSGSASTLNDVFLPRFLSQISSGNFLICGSQSAKGCALRMNGSGTTTLFNRQYASSGPSAIISGTELSNGRFLFFLKSIHDNTFNSARSVNSKASPGNYDIWTFQTNSSGVMFTNENAIGCGALNLPDNANILELSNVVYNNNMAYLVLEPSSTGLDRKEANKGSTDFWLIQYDYTNNKIVKENSFGGSGAEQVQSLFVDEGGNDAYLLGTSASPISGDKTEALKSGSSDLWIVKACLGADPVEIQANGFVSGYYAIYGCENQPQKINLVNPNPSYTYTWYNASTGGNMVGTGTSYTIPSLPPAWQQTSLWVEPRNASCSGIRSMVKITSVKTPAKPSISGKTTVCKGENVVLTANKDITGQQSGTYFISHWYDATGTKLLSTNDVFTINNIQSSTTLLLSTIDSIPPFFNIISGANCESQLLTVNVVIDEPKTPIVQYTNPTCIYTSTILTVTNRGRNAVNWYDNSQAKIYTGNPLTYTNKGMIDTIYCQMITVSGCVSSQAQIVLNVQHNTPSPAAILNTYFSMGQNIFPTCSNSSATMNVALPNSSYNYNWYTTPSGGSAVYAGSSYTIPNINYNSNYEYWVNASDGYCMSGRTDVKIRPIKTPGLPKIISGPSLVCKHDTVILIAQNDTSTQAGGVFFNRWYNAANQLLHTGDTLVVPGILNTTTFYCSSVDSIPQNYFPGLGPYSCEGPKIYRLVTVDSAATPIVQYTNPTCIYTPSALSVSNASGNTVNWYDNTKTLIYTGNPFTYTNNSMTDTLYCDMSTINGCQSVKTRIVLNVQHVSPSRPVILNTYFSFGQNLFPTCLNYPATINVGFPNANYKYNWYDAPYGGNTINVGNAYTTPTINYNTVNEYWICSDDGYCMSGRTDVLVQPIKTPGIPKIISGPTVICKYDTVILIARKDTSTQGGGIFFNRWYNAANQLLHTGDTLVVRGILNTTTFYCSSVDSIGYNYFPGLGPYSCEGPKVSRLVTVDSAAAPLIQFVNPTCMYTPTTLVISNAGGNVINWYNSAGKIINNSNPFVYSNIHETDTLYCQLVSGIGCLSRRTQVIIKVQHSLPGTPDFLNTYSASGQQLFPTCSNTSAILNVKFPNSSYNYNWYDAATGGNVVNVGTAYTIPSINFNSTYEYWVASYDGTCIGSRKEVKVQPLRTPGQPKIIGSNGHTCRYDTVLLVAKKDTFTQAGGKFFHRWYNSANQLLHTGDTLIIPNILSASTFYCSSVDSLAYNYFPKLGPYSCEGPRAFYLVNFDTVINPIIKIPPTVCKGFNIPLSVTNAVNSSIAWYNKKGSLLSGGLSYTIPYIQQSDTLFTQATGLNACKSRKVQTIVVPDNPVANFSSIKTQLNSGDIIQFSNLSVGASKWAWDFGDESTSTNLNPWHYFYNTGYYDITLIATSPVGCVDTLKKKNYIQVLGGNGINEYSILKDVKLFPNPFREGVWVDIPLSLNTVSAVLKNIVGQQLRQYTITGKEFISLNDLAAGMYMLQITKESEVLNIKIVKE